MVLSFGSTLEKPSHYQKEVSLMSYQNYCTSSHNLLDGWAIMFGKETRPSLEETCNLGTGPWKTAELHCLNILAQGLFRRLLCLHTPDKTEAVFIAMS